MRQRRGGWSRTRASDGFKADTFGVREGQITFQMPRLRDAPGVEYGMNLEHEVLQLFHGIVYQP